RSDWATIHAFYHALITPSGGLSSLNPGPSVLPLALTRVSVAPPPLITLPQETLTSVLVNQDDSRYLPSSGARVLLYSQDGSRVTDLGSPTADGALVRGAHQGDRLCVYDQPRQHLGCRTALSPADPYLPMAPIDWHP